ncbi:MAG: hypothetical protein KJ593_02410 [Candidatus Omnitrophica bacterium]|nr:hypothetical protein [Candidatus Omnitrophota bacterium]
MRKINLNSLVRPKFLWISIIVLLLVTSTIFYILEEKQKALRVLTQKQLAKTVEEKDIIQRDLRETSKAKRRVEEELKEKKYQIKLTLDRLEKEINVRRQAEGQLIVVLREKWALQDELSKFTRKPKTIGLERIIVSAAPVLVGKVLAVEKEHRFVVVNLGKENNIKLGDILSVYRKGEFIGRVQIEKVKEEISTASILPEWQDLEFKENDEVRKI